VGLIRRQEITLVSELNTPSFPELGGVIEIAIGIERKHIDFDPEEMKTQRVNAPGVHSFAPANLDAGCMDTIP
jgi:hypothetical protein